MTFEASAEVYAKHVGRYGNQLAGDHHAEPGSHRCGGCRGGASTGSGGGSGELFEEGLNARAQSADGFLARHHGIEAALKHHRGRKVLDLQEPFGGLLECFLGDESDDL